MSSPPMIATDAAARLRQLDGVREQVRRRALTPSFPLFALGGLLAVHGLLVALRPDAAPLMAIVLFLLVARPVWWWQRQRMKMRTGVVVSSRARLASALTALLAVAFAVYVGASPLLTGVCVAPAVAAYFVGMPEIGLAAITIGVVGDLALLDHAPHSATEVLVGAGLVGLAFACRARERRPR